jgi:hypothetical protein
MSTSIPTKNDQVKVKVKVRSGKRPMALPPWLITELGVR